MTLASTAACGTLSFLASSSKKFCDAASMP